ncbi:MAG TPA: hypothetical protein PK668_02165 [Myxococcota bacterium]|nr:hypothetical protein [Myxococcota bacterium]HRY94626.1 hypothetical protein [Myxococcota bacterium]HSA21489.1 hypothetical protein [Myxococcota bacterium]
MRNALLASLVIALAWGPACAPQVKTYTGISLVGLGSLSTLISFGTILRCHGHSSDCSVGDGVVSTDTAGIWLGASLLAVVVGAVLWYLGADDGAGDSGASDQGLAADGGATIDLGPSGPEPGAGLEGVGLLPTAAP